VIRACQELPGQELFQYLDENGETRDVTSSDVNAYLREITGEDVTAKDFRTWHGTVLAALALQEFETFDSQAGAKRNIRDAIQKVAARLGNTPTICRKCYIHPEIITTYVEGSLLLEVRDRVEESCVRTSPPFARKKPLCSPCCRTASVSLSRTSSRPALGRLAAQRGPLSGQERTAMRWYRVSPTTASNRRLRKRASP